MIGARGWNALALGTLVVSLSGCGGALLEESGAVTSSGLEAAPERTACTDERALPDCVQRMHELQARLERSLSSAVERPAGEEAVVGPAPRSELAGERSGAGQGPDCSAAADLRDRICELADAICALAARPDAAPSTHSSCESGLRSCDRARDEVARACPTDS